MLEDPKSVKIQSSHQYFFALLGSSYVKAAHKMLMKLTIDYDVGNFLAAVGGNLGLLTGLSGLSVLFYLIKWLMRYRQ